LAPAIIEPLAEGVPYSEVYVSELSVPVAPLAPAAAPGFETLDPLEPDHRCAHEFVYARLGVSD
jgi:hypothetical protein